VLHHRNINFDKDAAVIVVGERYVTDQDLLIETVLGSCIAVCMRDPLTKVAGMNHFLLPGDENNDAHQTGRYGVHAMELLMNDMLAQGANRFRIEAKVFGGGNVNSTSKFQVGDQNTKFIMDFLTVEGIPIVAKDVGGDVGRRIIFFAHTGRVKMRRLDKAESIRVEGAGQRFRSKIVREQPIIKKPDLTLF